MLVTDEAAPTTPDITFLTCVLLQWYSAPSILLIEPEKLNGLDKQVYMLGLPFSFRIMSENIYFVRCVKRNIYNSIENDRKKKIKFQLENNISNSMVLDWNTPDLFGML